MQLILANQDRWEVRLSADEGREIRIGSRRAYQLGYHVCLREGVDSGGVELSK